MSAKASLRQQFRARRLALLPEAQPAIEAQARRHCPALVPPGRHLGLYWPLAGEADLRAFRTLNLGEPDEMQSGTVARLAGVVTAMEVRLTQKDKKPYADYIVTQWLLDSQPIVDFISKQSVPVHVGITGPMKISSLIKFANIVGAKNSINFLKSNFTKALDLLKPKDPNDLIGKVKSHTDNFHIYTFGGLKETNKWLKENGYV